MTKRLRFTRESAVLTLLWHELILSKGCHRGICLMRFKGSHTNRWGTAPVFVLKF